MVLEHDGKQTRKYLRRKEGKQTDEWFFNLANDPGENKNLFALPDNYGHKLKVKLANWEKGMKPLR